MGRTLTAGLTTEIEARELRPIILLEAQFSGGPVRFWNGAGPLTWNGNTFTGAGYLLNLSPIEETVNVEATGMSMSLSGIPSDLVAVAYGEFSQGLPATVWFGAVDDSNAVIADPVQIFKGRMDTISDSDDGTTSVITVNAESALNDLDRLREQRFTDQDQKRRFPGDRGLEFLTGLQEKSIFWGVVGKANDGAGVVSQKRGRGRQLV